MELDGAVCARRKYGTNILKDIDDEGSGPLKVLFFLNSFLFDCLQCCARTEKDRKRGLKCLGYHCTPR